LIIKFTCSLVHREDWSEIHMHYYFRMGSRCIWHAPTTSLYVCLSCFYYKSNNHQHGGLECFRGHVYGTLPVLSVSTWKGAKYILSSQEIIWLVVV